jgi:hypothetical protein
MSATIISFQRYCRDGFEQRCEDLGATAKQTFRGQQGIDGNDLLLIADARICPAHTMRNHFLRMSSPIVRSDERRQHHMFNLMAGTIIHAKVNQAMAWVSAYKTHPDDAAARANLGAFPALDIPEIFGGQYDAAVKRRYPVDAGAGCAHPERVSAALRLSDMLYDNVRRQRDFVLGG